jgi:hypothetical protein
MKINQKLNYLLETAFHYDQRSSLALDLTLCISEILDEIIQQVNEGSVAFNKLEVVILESANIVSIGEEYSAKIGIRAYDSTCVPIVKLGDSKLRVEEGYGIYTVRSSTPGEKKYKGTIFISLEDGRIISRNFMESYIVK